MELDVIFLNNSVFNSKDGTVYRKLTAANENGGVLELFYDESVHMPDCKPFTPIICKVMPESRGKTIRLTLLSVQVKSDLSEDSKKGGK